MVKTFEAVIDEQGNVRLLEPVHLSATRRALVTVLEDGFALPTAEIAPTLEQLLEGVTESNRHNEVETSPSKL